MQHDTLFSFIIRDSYLWFTLTVLRPRSSRCRRHVSAADEEDKTIADSGVLVDDNGKANSRKTATARRRTVENVLPNEQSKPTENHLQQQGILPQQLIGCYVFFRIRSALNTTLAVITAASLILDQGRHQLGFSWAIARESVVLGQCTVSLMQFFLPTLFLLLSAVISK